MSVPKTFSDMKSDKELALSRAASDVSAPSAFSVSSDLAFPTQAVSPDDVVKTKMEIKSGSKLVFVTPGPFDTSKFPGLRFVDVVNPYQFEALDKGDVAVVSSSDDTGWRLVELVRKNEDLFAVTLLRLRVDGVEVSADFDRVTHEMPELSASRLSSEIEASVRARDLAKPVARKTIDDNRRSSGSMRFAEVPVAQVPKTASLGGSDAGDDSELE